MEFIRGIDYSVFFYLNGPIKESFIIKVIVFVLAKYLIYIFFAVMAYLFWFYKKGTKENNQSKRAVIYALLSLAWAFLIDQLVNLVFIRYRPLISHPGEVKQLAVTIDPTSFPSSHSIFVFAIASSFYFSGYKKLGITLFILAAAVSVARIMAGVHYPVDVVAGSVFGIFAAWLVNREGSWVKQNLLKEFEDKK